MAKKNKQIKYRVDITWSDEDKCYVARVPELPGCVTDGATLAAAAKNAEDAIEGYLEVLKEEGKPLPPALSEREFSGRVPLRITPEMHRDLTAQAMIEKMSLNKLIEKKLRSA